MSFWQFLFTACWREAGMIGRSVRIALVTIPLAVSAIFAIFGGEWSTDFWPWWVWAIISAAAAVVSVFYGITRRAFFLENAAQPKLRLLVGGSRIFLQTEIDATHTTTKALIGIHNVSIKDPANGVRVILANIVSNSGNEEYDPAGMLLFTDTNGGVETINPNAVSYLQVAKIQQLNIGKDEFHPIQIGPFAVGGTLQLREGPYTIKFRISAENSPEETAFISTGVRDGKFFFHAKE